jgi:hypothetical protein
MAKAKRAKDGGTSGAVLGFEEKLWLAAGVSCWTFFNN